MENDVVRVRLSEDLKIKLLNQAKQERISSSQLIRQYIEKGLSVDGYKNSMDMISEITEQALKNVLRNNFV